MFFSYRQLQLNSPDIVESTKALLVSTARRLIFLIGVLFFIVWMGVGLTPKGDSSPQYLLLFFLITGLTIGIEFWIGRSILPAIIVWLVGIFLIISLAFYLYPDAVFQYFYVVLPFLAALLLRLNAGVVLEGMIIGALILMSVYHKPPFLSADNILILVLSMFLLGVGSVSFNSLLSTVTWASFYYRQAIESLGESRERQMDLQETKDDLTKANVELLRLTDRLKVLQQAAEEARMVKSQFVANVSHELRSPLNMIIGYTGMITRSSNPYGEKLPTLLLADIKTIQRNALHLSRLVDDVLDLSQIETDRMSMVKEVTSISQIIEAAMEVVQPLFDSKKLFLAANIPDKLPNLLCDPVRIRQILINILSNAGRFTLTGGVHIDVEMKDQEIVCHVRDTGPGIAAENQLHLFEPFQQADSSIRREHGGSGLGLHISKQLIEMHDGRIWLESKEGVGTTISFSLPVVELRNWEGEAVSDAKRWVGDYTLHEPRGRPFRGHVADPLPLYVLVEKGSRLKRIFSRYSNEVDTISCKNISDAIEVVSSMSARAVILNSAAIFNSSDNKKETLNPYDLSYDTPVITCWYPGVEDMTQSLNVVDHVRKPFTVDELREAIHGAGDGIKSILLIDEEEDVLQLLMRILVSAPEGYRVWRASSGERGIEMMRDRKPDLVIMDLGLPDVNGWEILSQKSQDNDIRAIPVIILSAKEEAVEDLPANIFMIRRKSGLSVREFVNLIQSVTQTLENNP